MPLTYTECKALKDKGFPQEGALNYYAGDGWYNEQPSILTGESLTEMNKVYCPTLEELITACDGNICVWKTDEKWCAGILGDERLGGYSDTYVDEYPSPLETGPSPSSTVCALWLALQNKK